MLGVVADLRPGGQVADELGDVERVAGRALVDLLGGELGRQQRPHGLRAEAAELHHLRARVALDLAQEVAEADLGRRVGAGQQQPLTAADVREQPQRRGVGPVQVVEHEQQRALGRRGREQVGDRVVEPQAPLLAAGAGAAQQRPERGVLLAGHERAQRAHDRPPDAVGAALRLAAAPDRDAAAAAGLGGQRVEHGRLADARLAGDHDRPRRAAPGLVEHPAQALELRAAPDQPGGGAVLLGRAGDQAVERVGHQRGAGGPVGGVLGEQLDQQAVELLRHAGNEAGRGGGRAHAQHVLGLERPHAAQQLVERDAEREQVAARRRGLAERLLGRGVARRAGGVGVLALGHGDAEVAQRRLALGVDPDVVGLDVAVHDPVRVRVSERVGDLAPGGDHLLRLQPAGGRALEPVGERPARHVARDQARRARVVEDVVDGDDVAVAAEPGGQPRLTPQPLPRRRAGHARERDPAVEREIVREPHLLARAAAELALQQIAVGDHAGRGGHGRRRPPARRSCTRGRDRRRRAGPCRSSGMKCSGVPSLRTSVSHPLGGDAPHLVWEKFTPLADG